MDQAFQLLVQTGKSAKLGQVGDRGFYQLAFSHALDLFQPGVFLQLADGQANAPALVIHADHLHLHILPHLEHFIGMINPLPGNLRQMDQPICAVNIHESAKVGNASHPTGAHIAF